MVIFLQKKIYLTSVFYFKKVMMRFLYISVTAQFYSRSYRKRSLGIDYLVLVTLYWNWKTSNKNFSLVLVSSEKAGSYRFFNYLLWLSHIGLPCAVIRKLL